MHSLALRTSEVSVARLLDLAVLVVALPVFLLASLPIAGYAVCAGAWLIGRAVHMGAERRAAVSLARGDRRGAMGVIAAATLGRVWLVALSILLIGLSERKAGLAAAIMAAVLVTANFAGQGIGRLFEPEERSS